jgi:DNA-binding transcriptional MerR regulator
LLGSTEKIGAGHCRWIQQEEGRVLHQRAAARVTLLQNHPELLDRWRHPGRPDCPLEETMLARYRRGDRYGPCLIRIDQTTKAEDITVQALAYLLQDEMVPWDEIAPWVQQYASQFTPYFDAGAWVQRMKTLTLPWDANALRPRPVDQPPRTMSIPQAAKALGLTERQLRYLQDKGLEFRVIQQGRYTYIPITELERLRADKTVQTALARRAARQRPTNGEAANVTRDQLEDALRALASRLQQACTEVERIDILDKIRVVEQRLHDMDT